MTTRKIGFLAEEGELVLAVCLGQILVDTIWQIVNGDLFG